MKEKYRPTDAETACEIESGSTPAIAKKILKELIRNLSYFLLYYSGIGSLFIKLLTLARKEHPCIILVYHRIVDESTVYLNKGPVVHHDLREFEQEMAFLKKNYSLISLDEAVMIMKNGRGFSRPSIVITFDDGYRDNYTLGYPTLRRLGIPATIYLTTGLIGTNQRTWPDQIEYALMKTKQTSVRIPQVFGEQMVRIKTLAERRHVNIKVAQTLKELPDKRRKEILQEIIDMLEIEPSQVAEERIMLNWDEVREMSQNGITFGSHSHTHPILSRLPLEEAKREISYSKSTLAEKTGLAVRHFAYPNGRAEDFSEQLRSYCQEIGFESVATVIYGFNIHESNTAMDLRRIGAIEPHWLLVGTLFKLFSRKA